MLGINTCVAVVALLLGTAQARTSTTPPQRTAQAAPKAKDAPKPAPAPAAPPAPAPKAPPAPAPAPAPKADDPAAPAATDEATPPPAPAPLPLKPVSVEELIVQYQRVGHELAELENRRGLELCATLRDEFRAIKISVAIQTAEARAQTGSQLTQMSLRIVRLHGIEITKACMNNPLAKECL